MTCPECGSSDIRTSKRTGWLDPIQQARGLEPFRCRKCRHRFFAAQAVGAPALAGGVQANRPRRPALKISPRKKSRLIRQLIGFGILALITAIFLLFLHYMITDRQPPDSRVTPVHAGGSVLLRA